MHSMKKRRFCFRCSSEHRKKKLCPALRKVRQFMMSKLQRMLQNGFLHNLSKKLGQKWSFVVLFLVPHPTQHTLCFLFAYLPDDVPSVLEITRLTLPTALFVALYDEEHVISDEVYVEMAEYDVSVLFQSKLEGSRNRVGRFPDLLSAKRSFHFKDFIVF